MSMKRASCSFLLQLCNNRNTAGANDIRFFLRKPSQATCLMRPATLLERVARIVSTIDRNAGHFQRRKKLGAQPLRLHHRTTRQFAPAHARRKPKIVFDSRAGSRLPTRSVPVQQQRP